MDIGSTVSPEAEAVPTVPAGVAPVEREGVRLPRWAFWAAALAILLGAAFLRLDQLDLRPLHHDEGVNGYFVKNLYRDGSYRYDPSNYHGPSLFYAAVVSVYLFGLEVPALRLVTVFFGLVTIWLAFRARSLIGPAGALAAALLLAVSPGAVFFSRYFIHEILLIAATLGIVVAGHKIARQRSLGTLIETSAWAGLLFATKETATPTAIVLVLAVASASGLTWLCESARLRRVARWPALLSWRAPRSELIQMAVAAGSLFLLIEILLYSSFFTNPRGVLDAFRALFIWSGTGMRSHVHPWWTFARWLWQMETPLVVLGLPGLLLALVFGGRAARFVAFWALGIFCAYSIVPYKTPWLTLDILLPLALLAGYAVELLARVLARLANAVRLPARRLPPLAGHAVRLLARALPQLATALLLVASAFSLRHALKLELDRYDDDREAYVYAHTRRGFLDLVRTVNKAAELSGKGKQATILVVAPEHWPLPWYLRDYPRTAYHDRMREGRGAEIVIGGQRQDAELARALGPGFLRLGKFPLRPGVELVLFVSNDIAERASGR